MSQTLITPLLLPEFEQQKVVAQLQLVFLDGAEARKFRFYSERVSIRVLLTVVKKSNLNAEGLEVFELKLTHCCCCYWSFHSVCWKYTKRKSQHKAGLLLNGGEKKQGES